MGRTEMIESLAVSGASLDLTRDTLTRLDRYSTAKSRIAMALLNGLLGR